MVETVDAISTNPFIFSSFYRSEIREFWLIFFKILIKKYLNQLIEF